MRKISYLFIITTVLVCLAACQARTSDPYTSRDLVGTWKCGPTPMYGPGFTITLITNTVRREDGKFTSRLEAEVEEYGKKPIINIDKIEGTWTLNGDVYVETINSATFISSTDPSMTAEKRQVIANRELQKTRIYKNRVLKVEKELVITIPVDGEYKEAEVEEVCNRA